MKQMFFKNALSLFVMMALILGAIAAPAMGATSTYDANNDGVIQKNEVTQAVTDFSDLMIAKSQLREVVEQYFIAGSKGISSETLIRTSSVSPGIVTRNFSASTINPGDSIIVTITPTPVNLFDVPGYQVIETIPEGFTVTANTAWIGTNISNVWTFTNIGGFAFTYTLTSPITASTYIFTGTFKDDNTDTGIVTGSSNVTVVSVTPVPTAGSISGFKINDTNGNGRWDTDEQGISNWTIKLMGITGEGKIAKVIRKETLTDATGFYKFDNLSAGRYFVIEKLKRGFVPTSSPVKRIKLAQGKNSMNNNFTNRPIHSRDKNNDKRDIDDYDAINRNMDKYKEDMD